MSKSGNPTPEALLDMLAARTPELLPIATQICGWDADTLHFALGVIVSRLHSTDPTSAHRENVVDQIRHLWEASPDA